WVYGQAELTRDLMEAREADGQPAYYEADDVVLHDVDTDHPRVTFTGADGAAEVVECDVIAGCDGFHGTCRQLVPHGVREVWERVYPYSWLGALVDVPPSTDDLIYAWHPDGFALHSMRSETVSRLYLQVKSDDDIVNWSDDRIWEALAARLGHGQDG